jgi:hypothetical protein
MNYRRLTMTVKAVVVGLVVQVVLVLAFVVPQHDPRPHELPVAVAAPAAQQVQQRLGDAVAVRPVRSAAEARTLVEDREVVGALLGERVLVASGASPAAAELLRQAAAPAAAGGPAVQDLAPLDEDDSRGVTLNALMLPLVISSLPFALLLWRARASRPATFAAIGAFALLGGVSIAAIAQGVVSALPGSFAAVAGILAAAIAAIALPAVAAARIAGPAGFAAVAFTVFLVGNPASGAANGAEFLPSPWRELSGLLQPGAAADALRSVAWFDGAGVAGGALVLAAWALAGAALLLVPRGAQDRAGARRSISHSDRASSAVVAQ